MMQLSLIGPAEEPASPRESDVLHARIFAALAASLGSSVSDVRKLHDATAAVVHELRGRPPSLDTRTIILRMCGYNPTCWICSFPIDLREPKNSPGSFTLDHVVPRSAGGGRLGIMNIKPAHRYCNILRSETRPRTRTKSRYTAFLAGLAARRLVGDEVPEFLSDSG
jgi:5-methylcytosine-specific restriction endonuclease McrA